MEMRFPIILDGATGTQLQKRGFTGDMSAEQWVLEHPESILEVQRAYVAAGSKILYSPTFGANRQKLEDRKIFNRTAQMNRELASLSRQAADGRAWVAGDIAPTGRFLAPLGDAAFEELVDIYTEQAAGLEQAGVDLFVIETKMTLSDARAAVLAVRSVSDKPIFVTFTCDESGRCLSGTDVAAALDAAPDARCVILTSPTYEGVLSDIRTIAEICHARGVPLLVDEAHGAHYLPFAARYGWRGGAVAAGADLVVQSAHKTLPSLTQTAFLQLNGDLADPAEVERQLDVFETSSPSYPLMVSLDGCTRWLADEGEAAFAAWRTRLDAFDAAVRDLKNTKILCCGADALTAHPDFFAHDSGKILLQIGAAGAAYLRADGFEPEMVCGPNVLAMTSPCDDADALERLADVLHAWDKTAAPPAAPRHILPAPGAARCTIAEALLRPARAVRMRDAVGETAAEYLWAYPPGVPLVAPGEEVTAELVTACRALEQAGTALKHTGGSGAEEIAVL